MVLQKRFSLTFCIRSCVCAGKFNLSLALRLLLFSLRLVHLQVSSPFLSRSPSQTLFFFFLMHLSFFFSVKSIFCHAFPYVIYCSQVIFSHFLSTSTFLLCNFLTSTHYSCLDHPHNITNLCMYEIH